MIDFIPFIKKFLNKKDRTLDEQIDDIMTAVGGSSEGAILASAIGSWVLPGNTPQTWTAPYDGIYRFVLVGMGAHDPSIAGSAIVLLLKVKEGVLINVEFLLDTVLKYKDSIVASARKGDNISTGHTSYVNEGSVDNINIKIIDKSIYENSAKSGSVPLIIPEFIPNTIPQGIVINQSAENVTINPGYTGILNFSKAGKYSNEGPNNKYYYAASIGYGAAGYMIPSKQYIDANPGCCIITLLKKE